MKRRHSSWGHGIEVLMCNGVSPVNQLLKHLAPAFVPGVQRIDLGPQVNPQTIEVGTKCAGVRIASVQASIPNKVGAQKHSKLRRDDGKNVICAFRMKVPTETLEMGGQKGGVGVVDLLCGVSPASLCAAYHGMSIFDLVQGRAPLAVPPDQRFGWHGLMASMRWEEDISLFFGVASYCIAGRMPTRNTNPR
jgi:hypothetical protein